MTHHDMDKSCIILHGIPSEIGRYGVVTRIQITDHHLACIGFAHIPMFSKQYTSGVLVISK